MCVFAYDLRRLEVSEKLIFYLAFLMNFLQFVAPVYISFFLVVQEEDEKELEGC